ncbi:MFS transporter [Kurthia sp. YJT4]|uniref:MFS transporter n=1 Tax=Kurthia sp. YJT4 TaxID=3049086 RepID=UPI00254CE93A|nr:MFS transporter [Kurthia sp. YJT4]WIL40036.1 MFS transporter [Kurthia sp. YJT4]
MTTPSIYYAFTSSRAFCLQIVFTLNIIYYVSDAQLNPLELVLIGTIMELAVLLCEIPTGLVADLFGRKKSIIIGTIIIGCAHLLEGSIPSFTAIAIAAALWGMGWTFISGAETAWIADEITPEQLDHTLLNGAKFSSIGSFIGILTSVAIGSLFTVQIAILFAGAALLLIALFSIFWIPETKFVPITQGKQSHLHHMKIALQSSWNVIRSDRTLLSLASITLFMGLASEGFDRLWGAHFIENFQLNEHYTVYWFGLFYALTFLLNIGLLKWMEQIATSHFARLLMWLNTVLILFMIYFAFTTHFIVAVVLYLCVASLRNVNHPLMNIMMNKQVESKGRATTLSFYGQVDAFGQVAGGPLVGLIALYTSIEGGLFASALLILPTIYFLRIMRKNA